MAQCMVPFHVKHPIKGDIPVPCGKCPNCRKRRVSGWSFRLIKQAEVSTSALFVTLTYDTTHVPITENGYMTLRKRDVQLFMKSLRKISAEPLKYYYCGEYGGKSNRPHYHMLLFNAEMADVEKSWQKGSIHYGTVNGASVGYTLKYMNKLGKIPMHKNDDRIKEFANMSKGLGKNYLTPAIIKWHKKDITKRVYLNIEDGKRAPMPRYYKNKIYDEIEMAKIGAAMAKTSIELEKEQRKNGEKLHGENYDYVKDEHIKSEFKKMYKNAHANRNKI